MPLPTAIFLVAVAITGCSSGTPVSVDSSSPGGVDTGSSRQSAATEIELRFDKAAAHDDLQLRWLDLEDSRCPIGVVCIWAGQAVVTLELTRGEDTKVQLDLVHRAGREPETASALGYELRLLDVEPHPKEGVTPERGDYLARIEISGP